MKKQIAKMADERKDSKRLFDYANGHIRKTIISTYDASKVYGLVEIHDHFETIELNSGRAIQWLSHEYQNVDVNIIHSPDFFKNTLHALVATAQMNGTVNEKVHTRIAQKEDVIYYDLGSKDWKAVKITKKSITIRTINENTPLFVRPTSLYEQVKPDFKYLDALDDLASLLLILDNDKIIFKCNLVALFLEEFAIPMPVAVGSAGSSKSTFTAYLKRIVDPSGKHKENNLVGFPKKKDDLVALESHRYMIGFDNVSEIDQEMSDELCRSITGGSTVNRKLYTNLDESISSYKNKIVLNGIVPRLNYPDLQTRIITYPRKPLDKTNMLTEEELEKRFKFLLPKVLGNIFETLQKAMKFYPKLSKQIRPLQRMADFEVWGEVIAQCLGYKPNEFIKAYDRKLNEDVINQKDQHIIVSLIENLMEDKEVYENQAKELLKTLTALARDVEEIDLKSKFVYFPKIPNQLTRELTVVDPILKRLGLFVESYPYTKSDNRFKKNVRIIKISKKEFQESLTFGKSSPPCPPSPPSKKQTRKSSKIGGDRKKPSPPYTHHEKKSGGDGGDRKNPSPPKTLENRHEKKGGGDGGDGGDTLNFPSNDNQEYFKCLTHNAGVFHISEKSKSSGNILEFHQKKNCEIQYFTKKEGI